VIFYLLFGEVFLWWKIMNSYIIPSTVYIGCKTSIDAFIGVFLFLHVFAYHYYLIIVIVEKKLRTLQFLRLYVWIFGTRKCGLLYVFDNYFVANVAEVMQYVSWLSSVWLSYFSLFRNFGIWWSGHLNINKVYNYKDTDIPTFYTNHFLRPFILAHQLIFYPSTVMIKSHENETKLFFWWIKMKPS